MADFDVEFTEIQRNLVSLCANAVSDKNVKAIYVFVGLSKVMKTFYFFYRTKEGIQSSLEVLGDKDLCFRLLDSGMVIVRRIAPLCIDNGMPIPTEIKMVYQMEQGTFDVDVAYDTNPFETTNGEYYDPFDKWFEDEDQKWITSRAMV